MAFGLALLSAVAALALAAPARAAQDSFGFNEDIVADYAGWADAQAAVGANSTRLTLSWRKAQPEPNRWKQTFWQDHHNAYAELRARGIRPLYTLAFAPEWARGLGPYDEGCEGDHGCTYPPAPQFDDRWGQFARAAAASFPEADFEIWNEPNGIFWQGGHDPKRYAQLVTTAYAEIKRASPTAKVFICGCASPVHDTDTDMRFDRFIDLAHATWPALADSYDGFSYHVYPQSSGDNPRKSARHYLGPKTYFERMLKRAQALMARHGAAGKPLLITELGYWTLPAKPFGLNELHQAKAILATMRYLYSSQAISGLYLHRGFDQGKLPEDAKQRGIGVLRSDRTPKPSFCKMVLFNVNRYAGCRSYRIKVAKPRFGRKKTKIRLRSNGSQARYRCRVKGGWKRCSARRKVSTRIRKITVAAESAHGNVSRPFTLKIRNPIKRGPKRRTRSRIATFKLAGAPHICRVNRRRFKRCGRSFRVRGLPPGEHRLKVGPYRYRWKVIEKRKGRRSKSARASRS